jgi:hypothetical protein
LRLQQRKARESIPRRRACWAQAGSRAGAEATQNFHVHYQMKGELTLKSLLKPIASS